MKRENKEKNKNKGRITDTEKMLKSYKIREREIKVKIIRLAIILTLLFLIIIYFILKTVYDLGNFTISLDEQKNLKSGLVMYESKESKEERKILKADRLEFMDNISVNWIPENINNEKDGAHNGENYIAYTFYLENQGSDPIDYWYKIHIDDVIKNVDKAIRVMIYLNDNKTIYARANESTGLAENGTKVFYSDTDILLEERANFNPGEIDKITIVVWIEGDDPDCIDALIGGEMKMTMNITEEHNKI